MSLNRRLRNLIFFRQIKFVLINSIIFIMSLYIFFYQIRLMIWKNYLLTIRKPVHFLIHIFWPLSFFFFLVLVRQVEKPISMKPTYFPTKGLVSSGMIPFIQTILCGSEKSHVRLDEHNMTLVLENWELFQRFHNDQKNLNNLYNLNGTYMDLLDFTRKNKYKKKLNKKETLYLVRTLERFNKGVDSLKVVKDNIYSLTSMFGKMESVKSMLCRPKSFLNKEINPFQTFAIRILGQLVDYYTKADDNSNFQSGENFISQCSINSEQRLECGWKDITEKLCISLGCCYDHKTSNEKLLCYFKKDNAVCGKALNFLIKHFEETSLDYDNILELKNIIRIWITKAIRSHVVVIPNNPLTRQFTEKAFGSIKQMINEFEKFVNTYLPLINAKQFMDLYHSNEQNNELWNFTETFLLSSKLKKEKIRKILFNLPVGSTRLNAVGSDFSIITIAIQSAKKILNCLQIENFIEFHNSEDELATRVVDKDTNPLLAAIVFQNLNSTHFPDHVIYKIRQDPNLLPATFFFKNEIVKLGSNDYQDGANYLASGFVVMQDIIDHAIIEIKYETNNKENFKNMKYDNNENIRMNSKIPGLYVKQMPYPCYHSDKLQIIGHLIPATLSIAWMYSVASLIHVLVTEKQNKQQFMLMIYGLTLEASTWSIFLFTIVKNTISATLLIILLKYGGLWINSSFIALFIHLLVYICSCTAFSMMVSVLFDRADLAGISSGLVYLFAFLPFSTTYCKLSDDFFFSFLMFISTPALFGKSTLLISKLEKVGSGIDFTFESFKFDRNNIWFISLIMIINTMVYLGIYLYIHPLSRLKYRDRKFSSLKFFRDKKKSYYKNNEETLLVDDDNENSAIYTELNKKDSYTDEYIELGNELNQKKLFRNVDNRKVVLELFNITKFYPDGKKSLDNISMEIRTDQIVALLGHNGAGKSTLISIICQLSDPTSGEVIFNKIDVNNYEFKNLLGFCPQHSILIEDLSVGEHFYLFGSLKNLTKERIKAQCKKLLEDVQLLNQLDMKVKNLSTGQKRRLNVALTFIGNPKIVILDEPTSGIDSSSRKLIWSLITNNRNGKSLLFTTHFLEEAEFLCDKVIILSNGKMIADSTPYLLKKKYSSGISIKIISKDTQSPLTTIRLLENVKSIFNEFQHIGLTYKVMEVSYTFIIMSLPIDSKYSHDFVLILEKVENFVKLNDSLYYLIDEAPLKEVFVEMSQENDNFFKDKINVKENIIPITYENNISSDYITGNSSLNKMGLLVLCFSQFITILKRRILLAHRSKKSTFTQVIFPALFLIVSIAISCLSNFKTKPLELNLNVNPFFQNGLFFIKNIHSSSHYWRNMQNNLENLIDPMISTMKMEINTTIKNKPIIKNQCYCDKGSWVRCNNWHYPPVYKIEEKIEVADLEDYDTENFIMESDFFEYAKRYAGVVFDWKHNTISNNNFFFDYEQKLIKENNIEIWYNTHGYHSLPIAINLVNNAIIQSIVGKKHNITVINHPLPLKDFQADMFTTGWSSLFITCFILGGMAFVPAGFVFIPLLDRTTKLRMVFKTSGLSIIIYWLANFIFDLTLFLIPISSCLITCYLYDLPYMTNSNFILILKLLLYYAFSIIPMVYLGSFIFDDPSSACTGLMALNFFTGMFGTINTFAIEFFLDHQFLSTINTIIKHLGVLFPSFCLGRGIIELISKVAASSLLQLIGVHGENNKDSNYMIKMIFFALPFTGLISFLSVLWIDGGFNFLLYKFGTFSSKGSSKNAKNAKNDNISDQKVIKIKNLVVSYCQKQQSSLVLDKLNLEIKKGENVGIIGTNGCGKSTIVDCLTGIVKINSGTIEVFDCKITKNSQQMQFLNKIGLCLQENALDPFLTTYDHIQMVCSLRGIPWKHQKLVIRSILDFLRLNIHKNTLSSNLSGGNKRKLSTALAVIGNPQIIVLDEATTGVDVMSSRSIADLIKEINKTGNRTVLIISQSLNECQYIGSSIYFLNKGHLKPFEMDNTMNIPKRVYVIIIRIDPKVSSFYQVDMEITKLVVTISMMKADSTKEYIVTFGDLVPNFSKIFDKLNQIRSSKIIYDFCVFQAGAEVLSTISDQI